MTVLIRAGSLHGYEALARSMGVDANQELARVGLSPKSLIDPDALIPYFSQFHLLEHTAYVGKCPDFGLRMAEKQDMNVLGPLAILLRHAANLGDAMQLASQYVFVHSPAIRIATSCVVERPNEVDMTFAIETSNRPPCAQSLELAVGVMVTIVNQIGQGRVRPILAMLPHARLGPPGSYARVLGCECRFEAPHTGLRFSRGALTLPLVEHNPQLQQLAKYYLDQHFGMPNQVFADKVRAMVRRFLGSGKSSQGNIASMLSIHPRTMQRRLRDEGHQFDDIVEGVRKDQLVDLLSRSQNLPLSQIALMLGYSEQAALTRSCRRWFNCTPTELRELQGAQLGQNRGVTT